MVPHGGLRVAPQLHRLVEQQMTPGIDLTPEQVWAGFEAIVRDLGPRCAQLLKHREYLQNQINEWHLARRDGPHNHQAYVEFLSHIGYLAPPVDEISISTANVDAEIATIAGPQLVVPVLNARFALNAANARWGSLYDALYGTDMISDENGAEAGAQYNPVRGAKVVAFAREFLDACFPLSNASHTQVTLYQMDGTRLTAELADESVTGLEQESQLAGFAGDVDAPHAVLLRHHGLHVEIQIDRKHMIGKDDRAGVKDLLVEAAVTSIQDCEDSVAAVDAEDKTNVYRNWLGLMKGDLEETFEKNGRLLTRKLKADREYTAPDGSALTLRGRSLLLTRNVGHLMMSDAVLFDHPDGPQPVPEGFLDAMMTALAAVHDIRGAKPGQNSPAGSVYIVKPKMHGPEEVELACDLFARVEEVLRLPTNTLKVGIMDEERRTTVNLPQCIAAARERIIFINTGFLDRTGDEIHTSMQAGPVVAKAKMKEQPWIGAYEDWNVDRGLAAGFIGKAQIGKGMWPKPDEMAQMYRDKLEHPLAGANCAWVPSPTGATLHALHYHKVNVAKRQQALAQRKPASLDDILTLPIMADASSLSKQAIQDELDNNAQGILGYVVRWIDQGLGCSKVPDIHDVGLMEDRATCRISSQHMANWLHHGICTEAQVMETMRRMAAVVDRQNAGDAGYTPMTTALDASLAFKAACELVLKGREQPSGYTEPLLHGYRRQQKAAG